MSDACRDAVLLKLGSRPARFLRGNYRRLYLSVREVDSLAGLSPTSICCTSDLAVFYIKTDKLVIQSKPCMHGSHTEYNTGRVANRCFYKGNPTAAHQGARPFDYVR
ncbi:hypothetical protein J6590_030184 [Homalodisca vitripennis]|nr:hypothetical protein J6590_030184 [Homalodisca vitripennis]